MKGYKNSSIPLPKMLKQQHFYTLRSYAHTLQTLKDIKITRNFLRKYDSIKYKDLKRDVFNLNDSEHVRSLKMIILYMEKIFSFHNHNIWM